MNVVTPLPSPLAVPTGQSYFNECAFDFGFPLFDEPMVPMKATGMGRGEMSIGEFDSQLFGSSFTAGEFTNSVVAHACSLDCTTSSLPPDLTGGCFPLEQNWLTEAIALPSPEEQPGDVTVSPQPHLSTSSQQSYTGLPSPDSSLPSSPQSSFYSDNLELNEVMSSLLDEDQFSPNHQFSPNECLPVSSPFTPPSLQQQLCSAGSASSIHMLLKQEEELVPVASSEPRKRKDSVSVDPKPQPKRRLSTVAKKARKKEQNKTAALRYRKRKRNEKDNVESKREGLEQKNRELKAQVEAMSREIQYLQKLWQEVSETKRRRQQLRS